MNSLIQARWNNSEIKPTFSHGFTLDDTQVNYSMQHSLMGLTENYWGKTMASTKVYMNSQNSCSPSQTKQGNLLEVKHVSEYCIK